MAFSSPSYNPRVRCLGIATAAAQTPPDQARQKAEAQRIQDRERRDVTAMPTPAVRLSE